MNWQLVFTCLLIAAATGYVVWSARRAWRALRGGCTGGCGCAKAAPDVKSHPALIAPEQLVMRTSARD